MKKVMVILVMAFSFMSCEKDSNSPNNQCNCGLIVSDNAADYSVTIRNSCSDNLKTFTLLPGDWMNAYVGEDYCITNVDSW